MNPDKRLELLIIGAMITALGISFLGLPRWTMSAVIDLGISFVVSGFFLVILRGFGLDFLENITVAGGVISAMTIAVFVVKQLVMPT